MTVTSVAFANGELGSRVVRIMAERGGLRAVFVHPFSKASFRSEIVEAARQAGAPVIEAASRSQDRVEQLKSLGSVDVGVSAGFGYIMGEAEFAYPRFGTVNLHTSLLPLNRGAHPNVWAIANGTDAGVTLHFIDAGVDTGDILEQLSTPYTFEDTAKTLYFRLISDAARLFAGFWPQTEEYWKNPPRRPQTGMATSHRVDDLQLLKLPKPDATVTVATFLSVLRARSFAPYPGAPIEVDGRRYRLRIEIEHDE